MAKIGLTGNLQTMSLGDLLQWASRGNKTGTMVLRDDSLSKKIYFRNGIVIGSFTNDPAEYLGQILISEGIITEQHLKDLAPGATDVGRTVSEDLIQDGTKRVYIRWRADLVDVATGGVFKHLLEDGSLANRIIPGRPSLLSIYRYDHPSFFLTVLDALSFLGVE